MVRNSLQSKRQSKAFKSLAGTSLAQRRRADLYQQRADSHDYNNRRDSYGESERLYSVPEPVNATYIQITALLLWPEDDGCTNQY